MQTNYSFQFVRHNFIWGCCSAVAVLLLLTRGREAMAWAWAFFSIIHCNRSSEQQKMLQHPPPPTPNLSKQDHRLTLIRGVTLCRGAFSIVQRPRSLATQNPGSALAQTGRTLLLGSRSLFSSAARWAGPALLGPAVPAGC